jgi:hypothetical protein
LLPRKMVFQYMSTYLIAASSWGWTLQLLP